MVNGQGDPGHPPLVLTSTVLSTCFIEEGEGTVSYHMLSKPYLQNNCHDVMSMFWVLVWGFLFVPKM